MLDLGCAAVGDLECDTVMRWTQFRGAARRTFVRSLCVDERRGLGDEGGPWKGLIMLTHTVAGQADFARHVLDELFTGA